MIYADIDDAMQPSWNIQLGTKFLFADHFSIADDPLPLLVRIPGWLYLSGDAAPQGGPRDSDAR